MQNAVNHKIKNIRLRLNMPQKEVADRLEISQSTYAKMEQGIVKVSTERLVALAKIFDVPYDDLLPQVAERTITFHDNQMTNGIVEHFYEASKETHDKHTEHLMEIIRLLVKHNKSEEIISLLHQFVGKENI